MTNAQIILQESIKLMKDGVIKSTGQPLSYVDSEGNKIQCEMPEVIHTFSTWKKLGYVVKKGEKAIAKFPIWKYTQKQKPEEELTGNPIEDAPVTNMFLKTFAFFKMDQVEKIEGGN